MKSNIYNINIKKNIYIYIKGEFYFVYQSFYHAGDYRLHNKLIGIDVIYLDRSYQRLEYNV